MAFWWANDYFSNEYDTDRAFLGIFSGARSIGNWVVEFLNLGICNQQLLMYSTLSSISVAL